MRVRGRRHVEEIVSYLVEAGVGEGRIDVVPHRQPSLDAAAKEDGIAIRRSCVEAGSVVYGVTVCQPDALVCLGG